MFFFVLQAVLLFNFTFKLNTQSITYQLLNSSQINHIEPFPISKNKNPKRYGIKHKFIINIKEKYFKYLISVKREEKKN